MFKHELKVARNIYDIMAIAYSHITNLDFKSLQDHNQAVFHSILTKYLEDKVSKPIQAFGNFKEELYFRYYDEKFTESDYFTLLKEIDSCEKYEYKCSTLSDDFCKSYSSLNMYNKDEVKIYPILKSTYRDKLDSAYKIEYNSNYLRGRKSYNTLSINYILNNYIIYDSVQHTNYNINIHELIEYEDFVDFINENKKIQVALFPITSISTDEILSIKYTKDRKFNIVCMNSDFEKKIVNRCTEFIKSLDDDIDFLLLPEMLITDSIIDAIKSLIIEKKIKFTFCGSKWIDGNNICRVFYEENEIFSYYKKIPFDLKYSKKELNEIIGKCTDKEQIGVLNDLISQHDFSFRDKIVFQEQLKPEYNIHVIDINNFGRIITYICRDIDDDSYMNISKILQPDFVILPACTPSNDLANSASILSERYHSTTIMCNTCSALCKNKDFLNRNIKSKRNIGFIVTPSKDNTSRSHKKIFYSFDERCKNCDSICLGRIFSIDMEELCVDAGIVSLDIRESR